MNAWLRLPIRDGVDDVLKIADGVELLVNAGEADVGDGIDGEEFGEDLVADPGGGRLVFELLEQIPFNSFYACAQNVYTNTTFSACDEHGFEAFVSVELLAAAVPFFDEKSRPFRLFERREPTVAPDALAPPADRLPLSSGPRIEDFLIFVSAEWTLQALIPLPQHVGAQSLYNHNPL